MLTFQVHEGLFSIVGTWTTPQARPWRRRPEQMQERRPQNSWIASQRGPSRGGGEAAVGADARSQPAGHGDEAIPAAQGRSSDRTKEGRRLEALSRRRSIPNTATSRGTLIVASYLSSFSPRFRNLLTTMADEFVLRRDRVPSLL